MRDWARDDRAADTILAVVIMVALVVLVSAAAYAMVDSVGQRHSTPVTGLHVETMESQRGLEIQMISGSPIPLVDSQVVVGLDGALTQYSLEEFADQVADGESLRVGDRICIVGSAPTCKHPAGSMVTIQIITADTLVYDAKRILRPFTIMADGTVVPTCDGPVDVSVLGTAITKGAGGPPIPVYLSYSKDGGASYAALFGGAAVGAGDHYLDPLATAGSHLTLRGKADGYGFNHSYESGQADPHVWVLANGDKVPDVEPFDNQTKIVDFLDGYVDPATGLVTLTERQVIVLWEFVPSLNGPAADFQDLVVVFGFEPARCLP